MVTGYHILGCRFPAVGSTWLFGPSGWAWVREPGKGRYHTIPITNILYVYPVLISLIQCARLLAQHLHIPHILRIAPALSGLARSPHAVIVPLLDKPQIREYFRVVDTWDPADAHHQVEQVVIVGGEDLQQHVKTPRRGDNVVDAVGCA